MPLLYLAGDSISRGLGLPTAPIPSDKRAGPARRQWSHRDYRPACAAAPNLRALSGRAGPPGMPPMAWKSGTPRPGSHPLA